MTSVFWDGEGILLVDFMLKSATINLEWNIETLMKLKCHIRRAHPNQDMNEVLLLHANTWLHTRWLHTQEAIIALGRTVLLHPAYSLDLAPSDHQLFHPLKDGLCGDDNVVMKKLHEWFRCCEEFYHAGT